MKDFPATKLAVKNELLDLILNKPEAKLEDLAADLRLAIREATKEAFSEGLTDPAYGPGQWRHKANKFLSLL